MHNKSVIVVSFYVFFNFVAASDSAFSATKEVYDASIVDIEKIVKEENNWFLAEFLPIQKDEEDSEIYSGSQLPISINGNTGEHIVEVDLNMKDDLSSTREANVRIINTVNASSNEDEMNRTHKLKYTSVRVGNTHWGLHTPVEDAFSNGEILLFKYNKDETMSKRYLPAYDFPDHWTNDVNEVIDFYKNETSDISKENKLMSVIRFKENISENNTNNEEIINYIESSKGMLRSVLIYTLITNSRSIGAENLKKILDHFINNSSEEDLSSLYLALYTASIGPVYYETSAMGLYTDAKLTHILTNISNILEESDHPLVPPRT